MSVMPPPSSGQGALGGGTGVGIGMPGSPSGLGRAIVGALTAQSGGLACKRNWGTVINVNAGPPPSVDITIGASSQLCPGVAYRDGYVPHDGDVVEISSTLNDHTVIGPLASDLSMGSPAGIIEDWAGSAASIPANYLLCDGTAYSRTTFADLFAAIGTVWGNGDGSTTFNVPDIQGRVTLGSGNAGTAGATTHTVGQRGGEETHTLTTAEMPSHTHTEDPHAHTQVAHAHTQATHNHKPAQGVFLTTGGSPYVAGYGYTGANNASAATTDSPAPTIAAATPTINPTTPTLQNTGGGNAHNNLPSFVVVAKIIKAVNS